MPTYEISWTITGKTQIKADNATHARELFDKRYIEQLAKSDGDLEVHDTNALPSEREPSLTERLHEMTRY